MKVYVVIPQVVKPPGHPDRYRPPDHPDRYRLPHESVPTAVTASAEGARLWAVGLTGLTDLVMEWSRYAGEWRIFRESEGQEWVRFRVYEMYVLTPAPAE